MVRRSLTCVFVFTLSLAFFQALLLRAQTATQSPASNPQTSPPNAPEGNVMIEELKLCEVLMFSGDQTSLDQLDRLSHDPNGDVAAEALQAKRGIRARLAAAGKTSTTSSP